MKTDQRKPAKTLCDWCGLLIYTRHAKTTVPNLGGTAFVLHRRCADELIRQALKRRLS